MKKKKTAAQQWLSSGGGNCIAEKVKAYSGRGVGRIWLSNLDIVPRGVSYEELARIIKNPCRYEKEYDDIVLFLK